MDSSAVPEVSVVMRTYNVAAYISDALESALNQSLRSIEVIVADDGSTDGTLELVRGFRDPRIRLIESPHQGASAALNVGAALAQGEFIALLDADDLWSSDKLARHVAFLRDHPEIDVSFSWSRVIDADGRDTGLHARLWSGSLSFRQLLADNVIGNGSSTVLRREAYLKIAPFDRGLRACSDFDAWLRVALLRPGNISCIPAWLTYYRRRPGQVTTDIELMEGEWNKVLEKMRRLAPRETAEAAPVARSNMARYCAYLAYEEGHYGKAARYLVRGFRCAPIPFLLDRRNWKMAAANGAAAVLPARWYRRLLRLALLKR
jgi:glycosyltransferase involved in cell wall biosynthesis